MPSSGQMQQHSADSNTAAGQRATNAQPAGANLNTVRTVPNNLHNLGAMPAQTSPADPNVVVTTHHTFAGNQVRKHTVPKKVFLSKKSILLRISAVCLHFNINCSCLFTF